MRLTNWISETRDYWRLKKIQAALEDNRLVLPLQCSLRNLCYTAETFAPNSVSLYVSTDTEYEPVLTMRCYRNTCLIGMRIDILTPDPEQPVNDYLLTETYELISDALPEGKLTALKLSTGATACYYVTALHSPTVSSVGKLFTRVQNYLTTTNAYSNYLEYQSKSHAVLTQGEETQDR